MILYNAKIYTNGILRKGALYIEDGIISKIRYDLSPEEVEEFKSQNKDGKELDCKSKVILPGIIDIHSHLRDLNQSYKETFESGTRAAAHSGITTVFTMPNTDPLAINSQIIQEWINRAKNKVYVNVGFIAGVPNRLNEEEIKKIIKLGVMGFKIYPHHPISDLDWKVKGNFKLLLNLSSRHNIRIFIHPDWPLSNQEKREIFEEYVFRESNILKTHDKMHPCKSEKKFIDYAVENYQEFINFNNLEEEKYPSIHFCHISCKESYLLIHSILKKNPRYKITYEITPHHLLLSNQLEIENPIFAKVMPPLRNENHSQFLYNKFKLGEIMLIGTDHAPHSIEEKTHDFFQAPSGFPGFETYPLVVLDKVCKYKLSLENFVKIACEHPADMFNLKGKGFIKEGYDADLLIVDKVADHPINIARFKTKAKFSPFEKFNTNLQIWKVFIGGEEVSESMNPSGKIITPQ
ncbi:MAG: Dihydroorotase [Promethearchaeota archaeon]|nr:MAG: Dihydroorotase [Candidatus Lokiarchaeota archaeon]